MKDLKGQNFLSNTIQGKRANADVLKVVIYNILFRGNT